MRITILMSALGSALLAAAGAAAQTPSPQAPSTPEVQTALPPSAYQNGDQGQQAQETYRAQQEEYHDQRAQYESQKDLYHKEMTKWIRGQVMPRVYWTGDQYYVRDWRARHLADPGEGYRWVRDDQGQLVKVAEGTGVIEDVVVVRTPAP